MSAGKKRKPFRILVTGDVVVDHHIYRGDCAHPSDQGEGTRIVRQRGGAGQTAALLKALCRDQKSLKVYDAAPRLTDGLRQDPAVHNAFATWAGFLKTKDAKKRSRRRWRVKETFGFGTVGKVGKADQSKTKKTSSSKNPHDVIVIDEGGLGFRNRSKQWRAALRRNRKKHSWVVLKMSNPVCRGNLWTHLMQNRSLLDRLIVIVAADDLRCSGASVSRGSSWEQSVRELLGDLAYHSDTSEMSKARHIIVNFGQDGALWVDNTNRKTPKRYLIFDPGHLEGTWQEDMDGEILGGGACLPASVARALFEMVADEEAKKKKKNGTTHLVLRMTDGVDLAAGIARGLAARRALLLAGHGKTGGREPRFPFKSVLKALKGGRSGNMTIVSVPDSAIPKRPGSSPKKRPEWSIIAGDPAGGHRPLFGRAREVAVKGETVLSGIPHGRFGKLYTVDQIELHGFYGIRRLITDYRTEKKPDKPLSIGVFGPPGSGKSFGIKEIARGILGDKVPILTFNLSQFDDPSMLIGALHQVRDAVLKGEVPVVFWDEFDSRKLYWLQYMLAPMNDGEFLEGQVTHPVGKCIFIFAGGTCNSFASFNLLSAGPAMVFSRFPILPFRPSTDVLGEHRCWVCQSRRATSSVRLDVVHFRKILMKTAMT